MHFMRYGIFIVLGSLPLSFSSKALATNTKDSNEIVVTASRVKQKITSVPTYVQIITKADIENYGDQFFVTNLLNQLPGVFVSQGGGIGGPANMFIRGVPLTPKVMMDGVDIGSLYYAFPRFNFNSVIPDNISRIEVLQGAQSGLWGANAASGTVNIVTSKGIGKPRINFKQTYGSFGTTREYLSLGGQKKNLSFYLSGSAFDTKGIPQTYSWNKSTRSYSRGSKKDGYHRHSLYSNVGYNFGNGLIARLIFNAHKSIRYNDICKRSKGNPICPNNSAPSNLTSQAHSNRRKFKFYFIKFNIGKKFQNAKIDVETHYVQNHEYYYSPPKPCPWKKGVKYGISTDLSYNFSHNVILISGAEYAKKRAIFDYPSRIDVSRGHAGTFLELLQTLRNLKSQLSLREDHYQTFGNTFTYKIGSEYFIRPTKTVIKSNWGTGFVPPSLQFLYGKGIPHARKTIEGNPNLSPEKSQTFDAGFVQVFSNKLQLSTTLFWSKISNLIALNGKNKKKHIYVPINLNRCEPKGIEVGLSIQPIKITKLELSDTYTRSGVAQSGTLAQKNNIPKNIIAGKWIIKWRKFYAQLNGQYVGTMYDTSNNQIGRYSLFNANFSYKISKALKLSIYAQNIFNKFYYSPWDGYGYATPSRSVYTTLSCRF